MEVRTATNNHTIPSRRKGLQTQSVKRRVRPQTNGNDRLMKAMHAEWTAEVVADTAQTADVLRRATQSVYARYFK